MQLLVPFSNNILSGEVYVELIIIMREAIEQKVSVDLPDH